MSSRVYKCCSVPSCKNTSIKTPTKLFVYVPNRKTMQMRNKWLTLAGRNPATISQKSPLYFCEDHFDLPNDMENYIQYHVMGSVSQVRMKAGCIPTRFECQPDRRKRTSKTAEQHNVTKKEGEDLAGESTEDLEPLSPLSESPESKKKGRAICRVCLASGAALRDIAAVGLKLAFEQLTKAKLNTKDGRPKTICHVCCAQLARFRAFRKLSQRAESVMKDITTKGLEITENTVSEQNPQLHTTPVLDVCATRYTAIHTHENPNECILIEVKVESEEVDIKLEDNALTGVPDCKNDNAMETDILEIKLELDPNNEEKDKEIYSNNVDDKRENNSLSEVDNTEIDYAVRETGGIKIKVEIDEETYDDRYSYKPCPEVFTKCDSEINAPSQIEEPSCKRAKTSELGKDRSKVTSLCEFGNESSNMKDSLNKDKTTEHRELLKES